MKRTDGVRWLIGILLLSLAILPASAQQKRLPGQSATLLPDGRTLFAGGFTANGRPTSDAFIVSADGKPSQIAGMSFPRAGHTAAVLPDGTVFVFGGVGSDGNVVSQAELYDPASGTFAVLHDVLAVPRMFHTATLLTDGTLLLAGGILSGGEFPDDVQLWDYRTRQALSQHALLQVPREGHTAVLLSDGTVRISGGTDHFGRKVSTDEIYDPVTKRFQFVDSGSDQAENNAEATLSMAESIPEDGAVGVPIQSAIGIRFTRVLDVKTVNQNSFALLGPDDTSLSASVTAAEAGRLVFLVPSSPLQPGTTYVLHITGATDLHGSQLPDASITFTTAGAPPDGNGPDWTPGPGWTTGTGSSPWQELPALQAPPGNTALAGQVLKLSGWPLEHVTLEMDGQKAHTDSTGRFLMKGLSAGHHVLWIDATTANHDTAAYGIYEAGVTILPGKTNVLNYTIWMTRLDMQHAVNIPSTTTSEMVITNPAMPGLELHLPPHTTITDRHGKPVRQISITPVPVDKPPFPLPAGVRVPIYFTIQPGGAYINVPPSNSEAKGARLIYPNSFNFRAGTLFEFWNYDGDARGWYIYGGGKVSADARQVLPDPGVYIYEFTGAMVAHPGDQPVTGPPLGQRKEGGEPVDLSTGQFIYRKTDLVLPDLLPLVFTRTYIANDSRSRSFGVGATDSFDYFMIGDTFPYTYQELIEPDGSKVRFDRISSGTGYTDAVYISASAPGQFYGAVLSYNTDPSLPGHWKIVMKDGTVLSFPDGTNVTNPFCQAVLGVKDRYGNVIRIDRAAGTCLLTKITSPNGRYISITNDSQSRITQIADNSGRTVSYTYDAASRLSTVTDAGGGVTTFTYDDQNRMATIQDPRGIVYLTNQYDTAGRVIKQTQADGSTFLFAWTPNQPAQTHFMASIGPTDGTDGSGSGAVSGLIIKGCFNTDGINGYHRQDPNCEEGYMPLVAQVDVTDPRGYVREVKFNGTGYASSDTHALGQPEQQTITYTYFSDNLLETVTDALGRVTQYSHDANGNLTSVTRLAGTSNAVTTSFGYEPHFNQLASVTDPLEHTTRFSYDQNGSMVTATDPLGHQSTMSYNNAGQMTSVTDALNNTVQLGYFGGDLVNVTDPMGNVSTSFTDAAGRVISSIDAQGNTIQTQYGPLNLVTQVTDAQGNNTSFTYDGNGNLLSLTDALNHATSWTYDNMDRPATRTDPLNRQESYSYDLNGNLASSTDRKGQVTSVTYDALNRSTMVGYNTVVNGGNTTYESTITYTYDAGNRMTQAVDIAGGTITETYDNLDRLTNETTAQGSISYGYDGSSRRTTMQVTGQPQLSYTYDNANRLTQIVQGSSNVGFSYDNINRRSSLTLPNGVGVAYTYDNDSRVTGITYQFGSNTLGNLTYSYDSLGRRTQVSGSFANTGLPGGISSATYDAANELTNWNGTAISYDLNGNMQSDGTNAFTWNARNQVATLNSVGLQYDAYGRRIKNTQGTSFLYDGANSTQELSGTTPTANLWTGGIDELFQRSDGTGTVTPIADALGSVIGLVNASGSAVTTYAYDPYGNTTMAGPASSNPAQYTGRENEGNGLYYYRARYYSPGLGRFISEDPVGFESGDTNLYAYVFDNPLGWMDPSGLDATITFWPADAHGYGHIGIGVNSSQTSGFYSKNKPFCLIGGCNDAGVVLNDQQDHPGVQSQVVIIHTTPEQDQLMQMIINQRITAPGSYNLYGRNCAKFVEDVLRPIGIPNFPDTYKPADLFKFLQNFAANQPTPTPTPTPTPKPPTPKPTPTPRSRR